MVRRRAGAGDALDLGETGLRDAVGFIQQARNHFRAAKDRRGRRARSVRSANTAPTSTCWSAVSTRWFRGFAGRRRFDRGFVQRGAQFCNPLAGAIVAFADQEPVALRRKVGGDAGCDDLVGRKDHAADDASFRDRRAQPPAGIEKAEIRHRRMFGDSPISYHQGMPFCANTTAVSSRSSG